MKRIQNLLQGYTPNRQIDENPLIEVLIRRGNSTPLQKPKLANDLICQDCGGDKGYTCWDYGKKAWFCAGEKCLKIDSEISKERDRKKWEIEFQKQLKESENQKLRKGKNEWDGN